jgi:hypothetical protein
MEANYNYLQNSDKVVYLHKRRNGQVFYVGTGNRFRPFNWSARTQVWLEVFEEEGKYIHVEVVAEGLSPESALELEKELIAHYGRQEDGGTLVNRSTGGAIGTQGIKQTKEHREKRSKAMLGKNVGRKYSDEAKRKISEASKKMWETRRNGL